jgi:hypothetical protein
MSVNREFWVFGTRGVHKWLPITVGESSFFLQFYNAGSFSEESLKLGNLVYHSILSDTYFFCFEQKKFYVGFMNFWKILVLRKKKSQNHVIGCK